MATSINTAEIPVATVQSATAASYVIPADRYAIVRAQVKNGGTFSIGGVVVLGSDTWSTIISNASPITLQRSGDASSASMNATMGGGATTFYLPRAGTNDGAYASNVGTQTNNGATFSNNTARTSDVATFKVPAGVTVVGAGDSRYHIELYRIPGSAT